ncbi:MAG: glutathione S-transferase C-terminal domain-containing protein [Alphaproteobacteria bacterium]|nr:glutathione S-transferase C-terminal domain-containing protein [Alphaproteobacteria bacterium]MCB9699266.1 glutathione S-transferase C-terminal domain-containing protein [Alphaproteobacteria bacterium]
MGYLLDGVWTDDEHWPTDEGGRFTREQARFRIPDGGLELEPGRYHLVLAHACPWCHRVAIARELCGLADAVSVSFVDPIMREGGWRFTDEAHSDPLFGSAFAHELYTRTDRHFTGRVTVPILWDRRQERIVCNESTDIVRIFDGAGGGPTLFPEALRADQERWTQLIYERINNGVYRCGFARTQAAYEEAFHSLFDALATVSAHLAGRSFLVGDELTAVDLYLFVTLVRFDPVYVGHFKCNLYRIRDDAVLRSWLRTMAQIPAFQQTIVMDEIKRHYYGSHRNLNPSGIVPVGPELDLE